VTDSLGRLVLRAQGRLPVAAPLLRSRYADEGRAELAWGEEVGETTAPTAERPAPRPTVAAALAPLARGRAPEVSSPSASDVLLPTVADVTMPPEPIPARQDRQPASPVAARPVIAAPAISDGARTQTSSGAAPPAPRGLPEAVPPDRPGLTPAPRIAQPSAAAARTEYARAPIQPTFAQQSRPAQPLQRSAPPEVRISIGRVEVHAAAPVPAMAPLPSRSAPARRPAVSLADYLAERGRAR